MLTTKQLFLADGLDAAEDAIKLVRHVGRKARTIQQIAAEGYFDLYQEELSPDVRPFHGCQVILSFLGIEGNKAEFYGAYAVLRSRPCCSTTMSPRDVIRLESLEKAKHGSRAIGLNGN